jgi:hypothetical protein
MTTERLSGLGFMKLYRDMEIKAEYILNSFATRNNAA